MADIFELREVPLFRNLPAEQLARLDAAALRQLLEPGEAVFRAGDQPESFYIVVSGSIDIVLHGSAGGEMLLATFGPGSFFGELALFDRQPRNATARAGEASELVAIPGAAINALIDSYPPAARQFLAVIALRLRGADEQLSRLQIQNANLVADERMTWGERIADGVARFGGSWTFILIFSGSLLAWMAINIWWLAHRAFDPFPFVFLNLLLSCTAALQAPIIMMSQNRQTQKDRLQVDLDYQVNIKAEHAIQQLHRKLDELRATLLQRSTAAEDEKKK